MIAGCKEGSSCHKEGIRCRVSERKSPAPSPLCPSCGPVGSWSPETGRELLKDAQQSGAKNPGSP